MQRLKHNQNVNEKKAHTHTHTLNTVRTRNAKRNGWYKPLRRVTYIKAADGKGTKGISFAGRTCNPVSFIFSLIYSRR